MKKLLLFILLAGAGSGIYFYKTNHRFKVRIDEWLGESSHSRSEYIESDSVNSDTVNIEKTIVKTDGEKNTAKKQSGPKKLQPGPYAQLDDYARKAPKQYEKDIPTLAAYLAAGAQNEEGKARILFTWMAAHIRYDDAGYNSGNDYLDCSAETIFKTRRAVCEGYSNLFKELATAMGLTAEKISGYAKGYGYTVGDHFTEPNHAWNAIKIDGKWRLVDVTWAAGYGVNKNGKLVSVTKFEPYWFDVDPKAFLFTHYPEQSKWQLLPTPVSIKLFENLPWLAESFFKLGFNVENVFRDASTGRVKEFIEGYAYDFPVKVIDVPYSGRLKKGAERKFVLQSDYAEEMALIDGNDWHYLHKSGNEFSITHKPQHNKLEIAMKINSFDKSFSTLVVYKVSE